MESVMLSGAKGLWVRSMLIGRPGKADMKDRTNPLETPIARNEINCRRNRRMQTTCLKLGIPAGRFQTEGEIQLRLRTGFGKSDRPGS